MLNTFSKKLIKIFHFIRICFSRVMIASVIIAIGTALLSAYTLINFVNSMAAAYKGNPGAGSAILIIFLAVPTVCYVLEKSLNSYLQNK